MTAQPTTPISAPSAPQDATPMGVWGAPQPGAEPYPPSSVPAGYPSPFGATAPAIPPRRSVGRIVGVVSSVVVMLVGVATAALFVFGPRTVEPQSVQQEIVRITQTAVGVAPVDVVCPAGIKAATGGTFTCSGTVDQQPVTYSVRQDDAKGHLTITYDRLIKVTDLQTALATKVGKDVDVAVNVTCEPAGRTVVVNRPGTTVGCTVVNTTDATDSATINATVDADGTPSYTFA